MREVAQQNGDKTFIYSKVGKRTDIRARMFAPHHWNSETLPPAAPMSRGGTYLHKLQRAGLRSRKHRARCVWRWEADLLQAEAEKKNGTVTATYIGGRCAPMMWNDRTGLMLRSD